jgi:lipoprotein-anchoring transpeptidase ErfK/SrfK
MRCILPVFLAGFWALAPLDGRALAGTVVQLDGLQRNVILVKTSQRRLYFGLGNGTAIRYPVGVGRRDRQWTGQRRVISKRIRPAWSPTMQIRADNPRIPNVIPAGAPNNPMGAAALIISGQGQYAIHGTNRPGSVGGFVSYGCFRMLNEDILDLYSRVRIGATVMVVP